MAAIIEKMLETGKKILISVGKNNKPTYAVMAVATANGIFKPISSLTDKKEKPEARKYAALREFLTEVVAVPTYWGCGVGAAKLGEKLFKDNPQTKAIARTNMMFIGVCTAALFVIPALCSLALKGLDIITGKDKKNDSTNNEPAKLDTISQTVQIPISQIVNPANDTKFGNLTQPNMSSFLKGGGLKI